MNKQVLSIEQMQHLKKLGVDTSKASMYMQYFKDADNKVVQTELYMNNGIPPCITEGDTFDYIFTLQDILGMIPTEMVTCEESYNLEMWYANNLEKWCIGYVVCNYMYNGDCFDEENLIDAAYEMLCWCVENGYFQNGNTHK